MNIPPPVIIETSRLVLRNLVEADAREMFDVLGDPQVMRFSLNGPYSFQKTEQFVAGCIEGYAKRGIGLFAIVHKADQKVIGYCGFYFLTIDGVEEVEIGYRLHPAYWNQGLATEASTAVRDLGFNELGLDRLISCIEEQNAASIRVAEKNGMTHEKDSLLAGKIPVRIYSIARGNS